MFNILHIEDNIGDIILTQEAFKVTNFNVQIDTAENGKDAINFLENTSILPDLILLDINMPIMNGKEFLATIKIDEKFDSIPVVMLTTSSSEEEIAECYKLNANAYVIKKQGFKDFAQSIEATTKFWLNLNSTPHNVKL